MIQISRFRPLDGESISKLIVVGKFHGVSSISCFRPLDGESISKPYKITFTVRMEF